MLGFKKKMHPRSKTKPRDDISSHVTAFSLLAEERLECSENLKAMMPSQQDLAATYRNLSDDDLAALYVDAPSLTDEARAALQSEIQQRGISDAQLHKLHSFEQRREEIFDRRESMRHKRSILQSLDPVWTGGAIFAFFLLVLIYELVAHFHR